MKLEDVTEAHIAFQMYSGYSEEDKEILRQFAASERHPEPGFIIDFLGSRIRTTSIWKQAHGLDGTLLGIPDPCDFHAEAIEWIGTLKAVRDASDRYVSLELGAGFGPWSVSGGLAARRRGIQQIRLYAVEGDSDHFRFLRQHLADNGFDPGQHSLMEAAVGAEDGYVEWPLNDETTCSADDYGLRPLFEGADYTGRSFQRTKRIPVLALRGLLHREPLWNLVHIDVQGHEFDICRSAIQVLSERVARMVIGTHSRKLDGDLIDLFFSAGWVLEHEKPARFAFRTGAPTLEAMTVVDGTQVWRNPRFDPAVVDALPSFDQALSSETRALTLKVNESKVITVNVKNTGNVPWRASGEQSLANTGYHPVNLGYRWFDRNQAPLPLEGRALLKQPLLLPGGSEILDLTVKAPATPGSYVLLISMVQEQVAWFQDRGAQALLMPAQVEG